MSKDPTKSPEHRIKPDELEMTRYKSDTLDADCDIIEMSLYRSYSDAVLEKEQPQQTQPQPVKNPVTAERLVSAVVKTAENELQVQEDAKVIELDQIRQRIEEARNAA